MRGISMMKNWLLALSSASARAIETVPRMWGSQLNSALRSGSVRAAGAVALGVAALRHEAVDDAMEDQPVVEMLARQMP